MNIKSFISNIIESFSGKNSYRYLTSIEARHNEYERVNFDVTKANINETGLVNSGFWLGAIVLFILTSGTNAYAGACDQVRAGNIDPYLTGIPAMCFCSYTTNGQEYIQSLSPEGYGQDGTEPQAPPSWEDELTDMALDAAKDEVLGDGAVAVDAAVGAYNIYKSVGGAVRHQYAANVKICANASCSSYINPKNYINGQRYYFENTSSKDASGNKAVYSCKWVAKKWLGQYRFEDPRFENRGVTKPATAAISLFAKYYPSYRTKDASGVVVPNTVTARDEEAPSASVPISCSPLLSAKLRMGKNAITCTGTNSSGGSNSISFITDVEKLTQRIYHFWQENIGLEETPSIDPSSTSGLPVTLSASGACSNVEGKITLNEVGTCTVKASQAGNTAFYPAQDMTINFTVKQAQTISFDNVEEKTYGDSAFDLNVKGGGSGNSVNLWTSTYSVCRVNSSNEIKIVGAGTCSIQMLQYGNNDYTDAIAEISFPVNKSDQEMTFIASSSYRTYRDSFYVTAESSVSKYYTEYFTSGACTNNKNRVTATSAGECIVTATNPGNKNYNSASTSTTISINKDKQVISFNDISQASVVNGQISDGKFTVSASGGGSGNEVTYSASGSCSIDGNVVTIEPGECQVTASQAESDNYKAALPVTQTLSFVKEDQTIDFPVITGRDIVNNQFTISATGGDSNSPVTFSTSGNCSVEKTTVSTIPGESGECFVTASQAGTADYNAAKDVTQSIVIGESGGVIANCENEAVTKIPEHECDILIKLYQSTNGSQWNNSNNWNTNTSVDGYNYYNDNNGEGPSKGWKGVHVENGTVTQIQLSGNNLSGVIPAELGGLTNLKYLYLGNPDLFGDGEGKLTGTIPSTLGNLSKLEAFGVWGSKLSGSVPTFLGSLNRLTHIDLSEGNFSGNIPIELANLPNLTELKLGSNDLSGSIPAELGSLTNLKSLYLENNKLSGSIPQELGQLSNLSYLNISYNQLMGEIPEELFQLSSAEYIYLNVNMLSGVIPDASSMPRTSFLDIPPYYLPGLERINVSHNAFIDDPNNSADAGWESSQTVTPSEFEANVLADGRIELKWNKITFEEDGRTGDSPNLKTSGYYQVQYATDPNGPFLDLSTTENKSVGSITLDSLGPGTYYYRVLARTDYTYTSGEPFHTIISEPSNIDSTYVPKLDQTINFQTFWNITIGDTPPELQATASSELPITYITEGACSVSESEIVVNGQGNCAVTASQAGNHQYNPAASVTHSFIITKLEQEIDFGLLDDATPNSNIEALAATSSAELSVIYSATGSCTVDGDQVTVTGLGRCTITASQAGNELYQAATPVEQSFNVAKLEQLITFMPLYDIAYGNPAPELSVQSDSGLTPSVVASGKCTISDGTIQATGVGACTITASHMGDENYQPANPISKSFNIVKRADARLSFEPVESKTYADNDFKIVANREGTTEEIIYASNTLDVCEVSDNTVTINGVGTCTLTADQDGDDNFDAADQATVDIIINSAPLDIIISDATIMQGYDIPSFEVKYDGFVRAENESVLAGELSFTVNTPDTNTIGNFKVSGTGLSSPNYNINYVTGNLRIRGLGLEIIESDNETSLEEGGKTDTVGIRLTAEPQDEVTVRLTPDSFVDLGAGANKTLTLTFDASNWSTAQDVTFTAINNSQPDGVKWSYTFVELLADDEQNYQGLKEAYVRAVIQDNDPGVILLPKYNSIELEEGGPAQPYYIHLSTVPKQPVTLSLTPDSHLQTDLSTITFAADESALSRQTINISALDDLAFKNDGIIQHTIITGDDQGYDKNTPVSSIIVVVNDNDTTLPGVVIKPLTKVIAEAGAAATYTINLNSIPTAPVTIAVITDDQLSVDKEEITFIADAMALEPQVVTLTAINDGVYEDNLGSSSITHTIVSDDSSYDDLALPAVTVTIYDSADTGDQQTTALEVIKIIRHSPQTLETDANSLTWRVTFSDNASNVDKTDFTVSGTSATLAVTEVTLGKVYDITLSGGDLVNLDGSVTLAFANDQYITDSKGTALTNTVPSGSNENSFNVSNRVLVPNYTLSPSLGPLNADLTVQTLNFTLSNAYNSPDVTLGTPTFEGTHPAEFSADTSTCNEPIGEGGNCTFSVTYSPSNSTNDVRAALLHVPDSNGNIIASALLTSNEGPNSVAARRLPDALTELTFTQNGIETTTLQSGVSTIVSWGQTGYQSGMESIVAIFECTQVELDNHTCAQSFDTHSQHSDYQSPIETNTSNWVHQGVIANLNRYNWMFTPNCEGDALVIRFYNSGIQDKAAGNKSLSLLIPGGLLNGSNYYDQQGRRLTLPCTQP